jgi:hypothetical protein
MERVLGLLPWVSEAAVRVWRPEESTLESGYWESEEEVAVYLVLAEDCPEGSEQHDKYFRA